MSGTGPSAAAQRRNSTAMHVVNHEMLEDYLRDDAILRLLDDVRRPGDERFASHRWLRDSPPKRLIYQELYGDLISSPTRRSVLDVGGGYTALTRLLLRSTEYTLLELLSHDARADIAAIDDHPGAPFLLEVDWNEFDDGPFDVIVANDLFPNVDQRLAMFLERCLPRCRELRLALTYYNTPRWYAVRRLDGEEVLHVLAWNGDDVRRTLEPYAAMIDQPCFDDLHENPPSLYANGRQVCLVRLRGGLATT